MPDQDWGSIIDQEAQKWGIRPELARSVAHIESGSRGQSAVSPKGARGIMQLMPKTAAMYQGDIDNPQDNIRMGVQHLAMLHKKYGGNERLALAAYNAGEGAVAQAGGVPNYPETQQYVQNIQNLAGEDVTPPGWKSAAQRHTVKGQPIQGENVTPQSWLQPPPGMPQKPTQPATPVRMPSMEEQAEALKRQAPGGMVADIGKALFAPSNLGTIAGGTVGGMVGGLPGAMVGAGLGSSAGQYLESGEVDPIQLGFDVATTGVGGLTEAAGARQVAKGMRARGMAAAEKGAQATVAKEASLQANRQGAEQALTTSKVVGTPAEVGGMVQKDILSNYRAKRDALTQNYDTFLNTYGPTKVGPTPTARPAGFAGTASVNDTRPTFSQLHARQSKIGDQAMEAFQSGDYKTWKQLRDRKERILDSMKDAIGPTGAADFDNLRAGWNAAEEEIRQPAVVKLMRQAHDAVSEALLTPGKLSGIKGKGKTLGGGTPSPNEIVDSLKAVTSPAQFEEFKNATRDKLVDSAVGKNGLDPQAFESKVTKMGGNFTALFDPAEQKEMLDAAALMKRMDTELGGVEKAKVQLKNKDYGIPEIPDIPQKNISGLKRGLITAAGAESLPYIAERMTGIDLAGSAAPIVAGGIGVATVLRHAPPIIKGLMKSPEARQAIARAAKAPFSDPVWDDLARMVITGAGTTGERYAIQEPPK